MHGEMLPAGTYAVYTSPRKLWIIAACGAAFVALGIGGFFFEPFPIAVVTCVLSEGLGAVGFMGIVRETRLLRLPLMLFDRGGITYRSGTTVQYVAWDELESAFIVKMNSNRWVALLPYDIEGTIARATPARQRGMRANLALIGAPLNLPTTSTLKPEEILVMIEAHRRATAS